ADAGHVLRHAAGADREERDRKDRRGPQDPARARDPHRRRSSSRVHAADLPEGELGSLPRPGGRPVLLRDHPAQGRSRLRRRQLPRAVREHRARPARPRARLVLDRMQLGDVPRKHHIQLRGDDGALRYEECFTRDGFDGPYTIMYHLRRPHTQKLGPVEQGWAHGAAAPARALAKRHYRSGELAPRGGPPVDARVPLLFNSDLTAGVAFPTGHDPVYVADGDGDQLIYIHEGGGT